MSSPNGTKKKGKVVGGNPLKVWPIPKGQKGLHSFLGDGERDSSGPSTSKDADIMDNEVMNQQEDIQGTSSSSGEGSSSSSMMHMLEDIAQLNSDSEED